MVIFFSLSKKPIASSKVWNENRDIRSQFYGGIRSGFGILRSKHPSIRLYAQPLPPLCFLDCPDCPAPVGQTGSSIPGNLCSAGRAACTGIPAQPSAAPRAANPRRVQSQSPQQQRHPWNGQPDPAGIGPQKSQHNACQQDHHGGPPPLPESHTVHPFTRSSVPLPYR